MKSSNIAEMAPIILAEIRKSQSILLCCHVSPDPDSVGASLAMRFVLKGLGKKVVVIKGDSDIPVGFSHFPGASDIVAKSFSEVDLNEFDLFISLDSGSPKQISAKNPPVFPLPIRSIVIDHHISNMVYADINLVSGAPATCQILYELFREWKVELTYEVSANLYIGVYTDTGGLKYKESTPRSYEIMTDLVSKVPDFSELIAKMENSETPEILAFYGLAISSVKTYLDDKIAIASVSKEDLIKCGVDDIKMSSSFISGLMKIVNGWKVIITMVEYEPQKIKCSFRTNDVINFPVDKLAFSLGGGGHMAAAGLRIDMPLDQAKKLIVSKAKEMYNL